MEQRFVLLVWHFPFNGIMICDMSIFAHVGSMPSLVSGHAEHMLISKMNIICYVALAFLFTCEGVSHLISIFGRFYACFEGKT